MSSANPFRMECPKCTSTNVDLEEDQRAYLGGGRHQVQLHCYTCGHIIYGEKRIQAECDRQYQAWEATHKDRVPAPAAPAPAPEPAPAPAPAAEAPAPAEAAAPAPAAQAPAPAPAAPAPAPARARARKPAAAKAPAPAPEAAEEDPGPGRNTGEIDDATGLEIVVPTYDPPVDKKGRSIKPCAWPPCPRYSRPNSKYCSRNCSNKNARARYARRNDT